MRAMARRQRVRWHELVEPQAGSLPEGRPVRVMVGKVAVCLVRYEGRLFALEDVCPHQGRSFTGGSCERGRIICPWHLKSFDLITGQGLLASEGNARVFPVEEKNGQVRIGMPRRSFSLFGLRLG